MTNIEQLEEKLNYVHCVFQELESMAISLPIGDYNICYSYLEEAREHIRLLIEQRRRENPEGYTYITKEGFVTWE